MLTVVCSFCRYTSIGSIYDTLPNEALQVVSTCEGEGSVVASKLYRPAYLLRDGRLERAGRTKKQKRRNTEDVKDNGLSVCGANTLCAAAVIIVGDEIL